MDSAVTVCYRTQKITPILRVIGERLLSYHLAGRGCRFTRAGPGKEGAVWEIRSVRPKDPLVLRSVRLLQSREFVTATLRARIRYTVAATFLNYVLMEDCMRAVTDQSRLTLKDFGTLHFVLGVGVIIFGIVLFAMIPFVINESESYLPLIVTLAGVVTIATWTRFEATFDKSEGKLTIRHKGLFRNRTDEAPLSEISSIEYRKGHEISHGSSSRRGHRGGPSVRVTETVMLIFRKANMVPVPIFSQTRSRGLMSVALSQFEPSIPTFGPSNPSFGPSASMFRKSKALRIGQKVAAFLGIPFTGF